MLTAGYRYSFDVAGTGVGNTLGDPTLTVRNAKRQQVAFNDDFGGSRNSHITFAPSSSGTYYLDVGSFNRIGTYLLSVSG